MKYVRSFWTLGLVGLLLAACSSTEPPLTDAITTQAVEVSYTLEARFAAYPRGDVNRDRRITGADLGIVNSAIRSGNLEGLSDFQRYQADYTCDGVLDIDDIRGIQARQRNDKAPAEVQVCGGEGGLVLISNVGDLPFNGFEVRGTAGIEVVLEAILYLTPTPTTFAYTIDVDAGISDGTIIISGANITTIRLDIDDLDLAPELGNLAEVVASRPELSTLLDAVVAAGLADALTADGELTVFAPVNAGFADLLAQEEVDSLEALIAATSIEFVSEVLQFHIVPGTLSAADLLAQINAVEGNTITLETLTGGGLTVSLVDGNLQLQDDTKVLEANIEASNGIIHVVDSVVSFSNDTTKWGTISPSDTVNDQLETLDNYFFGSFAGQAVRTYFDVYVLENASVGQTITVTIESDAFVPVLALFDVDNATPIDTSQTGSLSFEVAPDVTYGLEISSNTDTLGTYTLTASADAPALQSIAALASADTDLSALVGNLTSEQVALLSDETQNLTVLAPVNAAFTAASELLATLSPEQIAAVINYHVIAGEFFAADVASLAGQTLPNTDIAVSVVDGNVFLQGSGNDSPVQVIATDIDASNGVIHKLDGILLPVELPSDPLPTIAEVASTDTELSSLVGALNAEQTTLLSDASQTLTVLAPVNDAFTAAAELIATLSPEQVAAVINYHVLAGRFLAADVIALDGQTLPNSDIAVSVLDGNVFLQGAGNDSPVQVIATDIEAINGVIHKLDGVLLPPGLTTGEATISGRVFNDTNQNNTQDAGEAGLENFTVSAFVDTNANGSLDAGEVPFSATTDADGNYTITGLDPTATYVVTQQLPFGWRNVVASDAPGIVTQIIGGGGADIAEYPFKVALINNPEDPFTSFYTCGASLISDRWVLSAAHCFEDVPPQETVDQGLFVLLGASNLEAGQGQTAQVVEIINHPLYQNGNISAGYDVTLLRLAERVNAPTVPLVTPETRNLVAAGTRGIALGWGTSLKTDGPLSQQLQEVDVPIISNEECLPLLGGPGSVDNFDTQLCAVRPTGGVDACQGDSGGMFIVRNATNTGWLQAGVTSYGGDCGAPNDPGVYARMDTLASWIFENASEAGGTVTVDLLANANATANFGNVSTLNPQEDAGDLFFLNDFDIDPTPIREVPVGEPLTFSWNISNTETNAVCTLSYVTATETEEVFDDGFASFTIELGTEEIAIGTVDPCVPGDNTANFAGFTQAGNYNITLTVTGENKTRTRTLYLTVQ